MRILITGGAGFIGRNLTESLCKTEVVFSPKRNDLDMRDEISIGRYIKRHRIDTIIHAAVASGDYVFLDNIRMHINLLKVAPFVNKVLYFGSGAEYSKARSLNKVREIEVGKVLPTDQYGLAKYVCNSLGSSQNNIINLRLFGVYGKYEDYLHTFISNAIVKNIYKLPICINQNVIFDYLYIDDLISITRSFLSITPKHRSYNITPTHSIALSTIAELINKISDHRVIVTFKHAGYNLRYTGDNAKLVSELKTVKFTRMEDGIRSLYEYYSSIKSSINKDMLLKDHYLKKLNYRKTN